ncbi:MAG: hypothetical protein ABIQ52_12965 [Vicinamibacterales bacterium]
MLRRLAGATGGEAFFPKTKADVTPLLERIARDIRSGYTVGYVPPSRSTAQPRRVRVDVRTADGRKLAARARSAYIDARGGGR